MIIDFNYSDRKNKKYYVLLNNGQKIHFGDKNGMTYIDHKNKKLRENYIKRHYNNPLEMKKLNDLIIDSPSVLSCYILWGPYHNIYDNLHNLINLWRYHKGYKLIKNNDSIEYKLVNKKNFPMGE
jgi:hypothetical protein